jgi:hypothetical protein
VNQELFMICDGCGEMAYCEEWGAVDLCEHCRAIAQDEEFYMLSSELSNENLHTREI